jgi:hypothetical protein
MHRSLIGQDLAVSTALWRKHSGASKLTKGGRQTHVRYVALGIKSPDEVRYVRDAAGKESRYFVARFTRGHAEVAVQAVFRWSGNAWEPVTGYQGKRRSWVRDHRRWRQMHGRLLWRESRS